MHFQHQIRQNAIYLITLLFVLASCSGSGTDPYGNGNNNNDNNDDNPINEIGSEPTFANVQMIFSQNCGNCHTGRSDSGVNLSNYENVMNSVGDQYGREVVQSGEPDSSPLIDKIEASPEIGSRMPEGGPFLSSERINQIRDWIEEGAENN